MQNPNLSAGLPLRVVFFGTGEIAIPTFLALLARKDVEVLGLVTQPDKPVGRQQVVHSPEIKHRALAAGVAVWQPEKAKTLVPMLGPIHADLFVVMAYGQILPQVMLDLPRLACWNLHASLLPLYRGASPIQAAILHGDQETGVTVMHMVRELDAGDIVLAEKLPIAGGATGGSLHDQLAEIAPAAMGHALELLLAGRAPRTPQDPENATACGKLERKDGRIDWGQPAELIERRIRAYDPWPGTFTHLPDGRILKLFPPVEIVESTGGPGEIIMAGDQGILVATGSKSLRITDVQAEGRRRMPSAEFLRGLHCRGASLGFLH